MATNEKTLIRISLKFFNSVMALVGIPMILYGLWMLLAWQRENEGAFDFTALWFVYSVLSIGVTFCLVTCLGHVSADSADSFCLNCYSAITGMIIFMETLVVADILLDSDWENALPDDQTGWFQDFEHYISTNFDIFKWIGFLIVLAQALSMTLALTLKALDENNPPNYGNYDDYPPASFPLIYHNLDSLYAVGDPGFTSKNDPWKAEKLKTVE